MNFGQFIHNFYLDVQQQIEKYNRNKIDRPC